MLCKRMLVAAAHTAFCDCCEASVQRIRDLTLMYGARQLLGMPFVACKLEMLLSQSNLQTSTAQLTPDMPMLSQLKLVDLPSES